MPSRRSHFDFPTLFTAVALVGIYLFAAESRTAPKRGRGAFNGPSPADEPLSDQVTRAVEPGRGRGAESPAQIPWRGWKDILWRTYQEVGDDRLLAVAAGAVFYLLLAMFPAITALVSSYGLFAKTSTISEHLAIASGIMPAGAFSIVQEQVSRLVGGSSEGLSFGFIFGLGLAIWSANAGMKAIMDALNVVYDESEKRGFFKLNFVSLLMTTGAMAMLLVMIATIVVLPLVVSTFGLSDISAWLGIEKGTSLTVNYARWPALFLVVLFALSILYRFGPSRDHAKWRWLTFGSAFAAFAWLAGSALLSFYLANFANYDATYGSLGAAIGLMMWLWLSVIVVLVGAELNAEIEHQTARDTTVGADRPMGARGATMADTVGAARS
jgi:membrane protein